MSRSAKKAKSIKWYWFTQLWSTIKHKTWFGHEFLVHDRMPLVEPPWLDLDPRIRGQVFILWQAGLKTTSSCQGGLCHPERYPTVLLHTRGRRRLKKLEMRVTKALFNAGYKHFWISQLIDWRDDDLPCNYVIELNFPNERDNEQMLNDFHAWVLLERPYLFCDLFKS